jgi:hypothetical protein
MEWNSKAAKGKTEPRKVKSFTAPKYITFNKQNSARHDHSEQVKSS